MAKLMRAMLSLLTAALLFGCAQFFDFNLFSGVETARTPTADDYQGAQGLDRLARDLESPTVVQALRNDPQALAGIEQMLLDDYLTDGIGSPEDQQAAVLYADLYLTTTSGDLLVNNVVNELVGAVSGGTAPTESISDVLGRIIPQSVRQDPVAFDSMIRGLLRANGAYVLLGDSIVDQPPQDGTISPGEGVPPDVNIGDVAEKAMVAFMVSTIVSGLGLTEENAGTQLYYLLEDPTNPNLSVGNDPAPDFSAQPTYLVNILDAAGLSFMPGSV